MLILKGKFNDLYFSFRMTYLPLTSSLFLQLIRWKWNINFEWRFLKNDINNITMHCSNNIMKRKKTLTFSTISKLLKSVFFKNGWKHSSWNRKESTSRCFSLHSLWQSAAGSWTVGRLTSNSGPSTLSSDQREGKTGLFCWAGTNPVYKENQWKNIWWI